MLQFKRTNISANRDLSSLQPQRWVYGREPTDFETIFETRTESSQSGQGYITSERGTSSRLFMKSKQDNFDDIERSQTLAIDDVP